MNGSGEARAMANDLDAPCATRCGGHIALCARSPRMCAADPPKLLSGTA